MNRFIFMSEDKTPITISLSIGQYATNDQNCIDFISHGKTGLEDYLVATVCLLETMLQHDWVAIKNYGENTGVYNFLVDNNIISKMLWVKKLPYAEAYICKLLVNPANYPKLNTA